ncbi:amino acid/amide ABC transporter membrane protein 2, HAAT family [Bradyrhizobium brasilense]|uniref:Amino acid/amide ABC transporter membrane protein 2, HAAT family n=1 Tax=Bradyrhizobium brasilense TaxID=1419277 RepID=A0A1G7Q772_9BRAD|nr:branched-chain amino acid ABC transporter permease [Bradyrhizobium brasilense]SDF94323.1 amino acid/amide ABC transporter membrane protein 2, HAAT family [Bradyrhizobium brasilense]
MAEIAQSSISERPRATIRAASLRWIAGAVILAVVLASLPSFLDVFGLSTIRDALILGIFALSLDFLWGKAEMLSFGHATFFGIGAYGVALVSIKSGMDPGIAPWMGLLAGIAAAAISSALIGYFLIFGRVRGAYFTIITMALNIIAYQVATSWSSVTGGDSGLIGVPPLAVPGLSITFIDTWLYYLVLAASFAALLGLWLACRGQYGRILAAISENEMRARCLGYNTDAHILIVYIVSATLAAFAGGIYVTATSFVAPDMLGLLLSTEVVLWVAVGGRGTLIGPFIGAIVVTGLQQELSSISTSLWPLVMGGFFILMVFVIPDGILSVFRFIRGFWAHPARDGEPS